MSLLSPMHQHPRRRRKIKKTLFLVSCFIVDGCFGFLASQIHHDFLEIQASSSVPSCGCIGRKRRRVGEQGFEFSIDHLGSFLFGRKKAGFLRCVRRQKLKHDNPLTTLRLSNRNIDLHRNQPPKEPIPIHILKRQIHKLLTIKELKELLRQCGAKVSGNKQELVDRLVHELHMAAAENAPSDPASSNNLENTKCSTSLAKVPSLKEDQSAGWHVVEPTISMLTSSNDPKIDPSEIFESVEIPYVSGLLFVNKPSGMSTLPTKQQQLQEAGIQSRNVNENTPIYPCLSDAVKLWLQSSPDGKKRMKHAREEEDKWWNILIQSQKHLDRPHSKNNPPTAKHKQWKKTKQLLKQLKSKMSSFEPRPVHRLDIDTSGIVCIALTPYALRAASMLFERKSRLSYESNTSNDDFDLQLSEDVVKKQYFALVEGNIAKEKSSGMISHGVGKVWVQDGASETDGHHEWACDILDDETLAFCRPGDNNSAGLQGSSAPLKFVPGSLREAITTYQVIDRSTVGYDGKVMDVTRVELTPHTGRGHQLRLHMAALGHPILGDDMHGRCGVQKSVNHDSLNGRSELCLHASKLSMVGWCLENNGTDAIRKCRIDVDCVPGFSKEHFVYA